MSLIEFVQKLQDKPRHIRIQILWLSVFVSMIIIVSIWVVSFKSSLSSKAEDKNTDELTQSLNRAKEQLPSLMGALKASIGSFFDKDIEIIPTSVKDLGNIEEDDEANPGKLPLSKNIND